MRIHSILALSMISFVTMTLGACGDDENGADGHLPPRFGGAGFIQGTGHVVGVGHGGNLGPVRRYVKRKAKFLNNYCG